MNNTSIELIEPYWERQPKETGDWYRRFCRYRNQIGKRSLLEAVREEAAQNGQKKPIKSTPGSWKSTFAKWHWEQRATAWDEHQQTIQDFEWDQRYKQFREDCWQHYELLRDKARLMLQMPIVMQTTTQSENGVTLITIQATDWHKFTAALAMLKLASELAETAIGKLSIAASLLDSAGFTVNNPKAVESANAFLNGDELEL